MFTDIDQQTLDISWFLTNGQEIAFMASAGSRLPVSVAKSSQNTEILQEYFEGLPYVSEVIINPFLSNIIKSNVDEWYLSSFVDMAKKGLYAFDKTNAGEFSDPNYHLVAKPVIPLKLNFLPPEIADIIVKTQLDRVMGLTIDISDLKFT